jgi:hypothetical protein
MKNKFYILIITFIFSHSLFPQKDSLRLNEWIPVAVAGLNISQLALSNWTQGGENSITITLLGNGGLKYESLDWNFFNNLKLAYGRTKLGSSDFRTNDNELFLESIISRKFGWKLDPFFSNTLRSALTNGYSYAVDPPVEIAAFFDPGYLSQALGFLYNPSETFNTRLGVAIQETFANKHTNFSDDPETQEIEKFKTDTGIESVTNLEYPLAENMLAKSNLRLFSRFESFDVWDVRWDNAIVAKVNDFLNVSLTYLLIYQKDQSLKTQMKEGLLLGFVYTII